MEPKNEMSQKERADKMREYFSNLNAKDKLYAVLGFARQPMTRGLALDLGSIKYDELNDEEKKQVDKIFKQNDVDITTVEGEQKYWLNEDARNELAKNADLKEAANLAIADSLWKD